MYLHTKRLTIRPFKSTDWQDVHAYTCNPTVMHYLPEEVFSEEAAKQFVQDHSGEDAKQFAVTIKDTNQLIGHISFFPYFGRHTYEIGWVFHPSFYNKGYATEAAAAVIHFAFSNMDIHRIIATCQPENHASYKIMEKIGMRREGHFKKCIPSGSEWWDEYYYAVLREEWGNKGIKRLE
ncbi:GNAT family N-acetyltransferase [Alkalicoccobacillus porphyridii]|uniref:GNAT family N-acetyltransferase n=1 Tax=Alkalicoccobacillus porphyridii TaxID=2597270 RepID=A0A554A3J0_9BACI|nr:GNAT family N-acetyltransferase [Alkalicoccobacillus porphyridii]TSB48257.1 GNAT family N-acetyltransferase [Alkalicoccobacillus porphyridii]